MRKSLFLFLFLLVSHFSQAQFYVAGIHFNGSLPSGQLKQETESTFFPSLSGIVLYEFQSTPIQVGLELGYGIYGSNMELRTDLYPGFSDELRLRRNNNLATGMAVIRYLPVVNSKVTPFIEAQMGVIYLYTRYKIREEIYSEQAIESGKDYEDWALAYRIGGGIQIPIDSKEMLFLELRGTFQDGNVARFLQKGDVGYDPNEGKFIYDFRRAPLKYMTFSVGLVWYDVF